jgi:pantoate--beta-alanine ligase
MPRVVVSIAALRDELAQRRPAGSVGLVPTMGALHAGHLTLIDRARADSAITIVSIFVNPLQFDREDDLHRYPRTLDADVAACGTHGVDLVFAPDVKEIYPEPPECTVDVGRLANHLCGKFRPGHFDGVATVVLKLLQIVQPDRAYFGEKDAQQLAIVRRLVRDFNVPVTIVGLPTVREADGLALSSRNARLGPGDRPVAASLYAALREARRQVAAGITDPDAIRAAASALIPSRDDVALEYLELVDPGDMQPVPAVTGPVCAAGAMWVGGTRLIDNLLCVPPAATGASDRTPS